MKYSVRRAESASDLQAVFELWDSTFGGGDRRPRHRWYYLDNPGGEGVLFLLEAAQPGGAREIVGCIGVGGRTFHRADTPLRTAVLVNLAVSAAHRTLLPALRLQRAALAYARERFHLAYGFPGGAAVEVCRRVGFLDVGAFTRYLRILRFGRYLGPRLRVSSIARAAGSLLDLLARGVESTRRALVPGSLVLEWLNEPDARFDRLWSESRGARPLIGDRSAEFLRWRFARRPGRPARIGTLVRKGSGEVRAYAAVVEKEDRLARIEDLLAASAKDLGALLDLLVPDLRRQGFAAVDVNFFGARSVGAALRSRGFLARARSRVVADPGTVPPCDPGILADAENWYLTDTDEDT